MTDEAPTYKIYLINLDQVGKPIEGPKPGDVCIAMDSPTWKVNLFQMCKIHGHKKVSLRTPSNRMVKLLGAIDLRPWPETCPRCGGPMGPRGTNCFDCAWQPVGV